MMSFYDLMSMSLGNLWRRKVRTVLTVLGVLIGTTSIVAMLSLAFGMKQIMMEEFSSMGSITQIQVSSDSGMEGESGTDTSTMLTESNMKMFEEMEHVRSVMPQLSFDASIRQGKYSGSATIRGVDKGLLESQALGEGELPGEGGGSLQLIAGNLILTNFGYLQGDEYIDYYTTGELPNIDLMTQVKVADIYDMTASNEVPQETSEDDEAQDDGEDGSSETPVVEDNSFKQFRINITGIMEGDAETYGQFSYDMLTDIDALKSYLIKNFGKGNIPGQPRPNGRPLNEWVYTNLIVDVDEAENVDGIMQQIQDMGFRAQSNKELLESAQKSLQIVELVLGGIGMVAFLVAAIGIANTMMMSTYERTKEIGVMKVLGCDMHDIQKLFLAEAGFIGFIGGMIGLGVTAIISMVINHLAGTMGQMAGNISVIPWWLAVIAVIFSTFMGMVAGYFPARRAMRLSPLAAIRTE